MQSPSSTSTPTPTWVATQFTEKYYNLLNNHPEQLHHFYKPGSTLAITDMQDDAPVPARTATTLDTIQDVVNATVGGAKATVLHRDAQFSVNGGVVLQVEGTLALRGADRKFIQTFFLATQANGFYVHNDLLRIYAPVPTDSRPVHPGPRGRAQAPPSAAATATSNGNHVVPKQPVAPVQPAAAPAASPAEPPSAQAAPVPVPPVKAGKPVTPVASPVPAAAGTSWAALVKTPNSQAAKAAGNGPAAPEPVPAPPAPVANGNHVAAPEPAPAAPRPESTSPGPSSRSPGPGSVAAAAGGAPEAPSQRHHVPQFVVQVRNLPQEHLAVEMLEELFGRFGALRRGGPGGGGQPVIIHNLNREQAREQGTGKVAYVKYEDATGAEAAVAAGAQGEVKVQDRVVDVVKHEGPLPSYHTLRGGPGYVRGGIGGYRGGRGGGPMMGGAAAGRGHPAGPGGEGGAPAGGRGGRGDRPLGSGRGDRRPGGRGGSGQGAPGGGPAPGQGRGPGGRGRGGPRREDAAAAPAPPAPAPAAAAAE